MLALEGGAQVEEQWFEGERGLLFAVTAPGWCHATSPRCGVPRAGKCPTLILLPSENIPACTAADFSKAEVHQSDL